MNYEDLKNSLIRLKENTATVEDLEKLTEFVRQADNVLESEQLFHDYQQWSRKITDLLMSVARVSECLEPHKAAETAAEELVSLMNSGACVISLWNPDTQQMNFQAAYTSEDWQVPLSWYQPRGATEHPLLKKILEQKRAMQFNLQTGSLRVQALQYAKQARLQSVLVLPLFARNQEIFGLVELLESKQARKYLGNEISLAQLFANHASIAIQHAKLYQSSQLKAEKMSALVSATMTVSKSLDVHQVLQGVAEQMTKLLNAEACVISNYDPDQDQFQALVYYAPWAEVEIKPHYPDSGPIFSKIYRQTLANRKPVQLQANDPDLDAAKAELLRSMEASTLLMLPLVARDKSIGLLELKDNQESRIFSEDEIDLAQILASHAATTIDNARLYQAEQAQRQMNEAMAQAANTLNRSLELEEVLDRILEQALNVLSSRSANLMLIEGDIVKVVRLQGYEPAVSDCIRKMTFPLSMPTFQKMIETRQPVLIQDVQNYPDWQLVEGTEWIRSYVGLPLRVAGEVIGFLNLDSEQKNSFSPMAMRGMEAFASYVAIAIHNARLYKSVNQRVNELEILRQASLSLTASLDFNEVLNAILRHSLDAVPAVQDAHIFLYEKGSLHFGAALWADGRRGQLWAEPRSDGLTYSVARTGKALLISDIRSHPLFENAPSDWEGSILGLPLMIGDRVMGVMNIASNRPNVFSEQDLRLLKLLGTQAAIAIENARLHNLVTRQARTDVLTNLYNRRALNEILEGEIQRSERYHHQVSLVMMDLDDFKSINDQYGHPVGDEVLKQIAGCLAGNVRNTDFLSRYGGDEFSIIMPETDYTEAVQLTGRIQSAVSKCALNLPDDPHRYLSISVGIATYPTHANNFTDLLKLADQALYQAKDDP